MSSALPHLLRFMRLDHLWRGVAFVHETTDARGGLHDQAGRGSKAHGLQILHERYEPGADTDATMIEHEANEGGIVVSGELEITVGGDIRILRAGDAYLFNSREPHRFRNISDRPCEVISACTPPYL